MSDPIEPPAIDDDAPTGDMVEVDIEVGEEPSSTVSSFDTSDTKPPKPAVPVITPLPAKAPAAKPAPAPAPEHRDPVCAAARRHQPKCGCTGVESRKRIKV